jgi:membrane protease YdiL (CAAX protease family)
MTEASHAVIRRSRSRIASMIGLTIALGSPFVLPLLPGHEHHSITDARQDTVLLVFEWVVAIVILAIVLFGERLPLRSVGFRAPGWRDFGAMIATIVGILVAGGLFVVMTHSTDPGRLAGATPEQIAAVPLALRIALFLTAGFCEELMFRGYGIERVAMFTGRLWIGGLAAVVLFTLGHLPRYGFSLALIGVFIIACFLSGLYLWRRNLWLCVIIHASADAMGLVVGPALHSHIR